MASSKDKRETFYDMLGSFELGINSGVSPTLLPKNQLSFATNATVRGGHISDRPPFNRQTLSFPSTAIQSAFETGLFQGAAVYRPDYGTSQIVVQISGRLFAFAFNGVAWACTEITIIGDPNDANVSVIWMWQSEKWLIISDGTGALPIFYDGVSCRRSYGPSVTLAETQAIGSFPTPRVIGEVIQVTLTAPYDGPYDVPVFFNGELYQPVASASGGYGVLLTNVTAPVGHTIPEGSEVRIDPTIFGYNVGDSSWNPAPAPGSGSITLDNAVAGDISVLQQISFLGYTATINNKQVGTDYTVFTFGAISPPRTTALSIPGGTAITNPSSSGPIVSLGNTLADVVVPADVVVSTTATASQANDAEPDDYHYRTWTALPVADSSNFAPGMVVTISAITPVLGTGYVVAAVGVNTLTIQTTVKFFGSSTTQQTIQSGATIAAAATGGTVAAEITQAYTGSPNQVVWIETYQYLISAIPPTSSGTLYLINLTDTGDAGGAIPAEDILSVPELPAGRMGAYGMGRNWVCLTDGISYVAGDIVGGIAGSQANDYRDAVLKMTENDFLAGGGKFRLPESGNIITSMTFVPTLDTSQGQGPLQIGTDTGFFSNNCPVDRTDWAALENPIQTQSLIGQGPTGQRSTTVVNSDILFRSSEGFGSLVIARRDFGTWGNTPISREVERALQNDVVTLLPYGGSVSFDNRWLTTCYPYSAAVGVYHFGLVALNFDLVSGLRGKSPPVYDGMWTGLNFLQPITGSFDGTGRSFVFTYNENTQKIELYELLRARDGRLDNGIDRIQWAFETPVMFREDIKPMSKLVRLLDAEIGVKDVDGKVGIKVEYRPDYYPCWVTWREFEICADTTQTNAQPGYRTRLSLGDPPGDDCESSSNRQLKVGHFFQFRFTIDGHCKVMSFRVQATEAPESDFAEPVCVETCAETLPLP